MTLALVAEQSIMGLNQEAIAEWQEYRESKKKPLSPLALKKSQNFLLKYGIELQQWLVDSAIMNDWQGLHYVEPARKQTSRETTLEQDLTDTSWSRT